MNFNVTFKTAGNQTVTATDSNLGSFNTIGHGHPRGPLPIGCLGSRRCDGDPAFSITVTAQDTIRQHDPELHRHRLIQRRRHRRDAPQHLHLRLGRQRLAHLYQWRHAVHGRRLGNGHQPNDHRQRLGPLDQRHATSTTYAFPPSPTGDFVVYRVGTGASSLGAESDPVYLDEYAPPGVNGNMGSQAELVETVPMPVQSSTGGNLPLTGSGNALSEGQLSLSPNGEYLALTGYDTVPTTPASFRQTTSTAVPRTVAIVGPIWQRQFYDRSDRLLFGRQRPRRRDDRRQQYLGFR